MLLHLVLQALAVGIEPLGVQPQSLVPQYASVHGEQLGGTVVVHHLEELVQRDVHASPSGSGDRQEPLLAVRECLREVLHYDRVRLRQHAHSLPRRQQQAPDRPQRQVTVITPGSTVHARKAGPCANMIQNNVTSFVEMSCANMIQNNVTTFAEMR